MTRFNRVFNPGHPRRLGFLCVAALALWLTPSPALANAEVVLEMGSPDDWALIHRDSAIDVVSHPGEVRLIPVDYARLTQGNRIAKLRLDGQRQARVRLDLDDATARRAEFYLWTGAGAATLNGAELPFTRMDWGAWTVAEVPGEALRQGVNELIFRSGFTLAADLDLPAGEHSAISRDGGETWEPAPGSLLVHARLHRHPAQGKAWSRVIDLAEPDDRDVIRIPMRVSDLRLEARTDLPPGTSIELEARTGHDPRTRLTEAWTNWLPVDQIEPRRYLQWRATLRTTDRLTTPTLQSVTIRAEREPRFSPPARQASILSFDNPTLVRSSYPFTHQPPSENLAYLRENWKLDEVVADGKTQLEKMVLLRNWVRRQWPHNDDGSRYRTWNAIEILAAPPGEKGMCVHYGVTFTQCALALGHVARQVVLRSHYVAEFWSDELGKWVLMDVETVQAGTMQRYGTALYVDKTTGKPMSTLELNRAVLAEDTESVVQEIYLMNDQGEHVLDRRQLTADQLAAYRFFAFPDRNNYLDQLEPWEEYHGFDHYHADAYLWWSEDGLGPRPEYSRRTTREGDVSWTVNQVRLTVETGEASDLLTLRLDTDMPQLSHLAWRSRGEQEHDAAEGRLAFGPAPATFEWRLAPGLNHFEIQPVNLFGKAGRITTLTVSLPAE